MQFVSSISSTRASMANKAPVVVPMLDGTTRISSFKRMACTLWLRLLGQEQTNEGLMTTKARAEYKQLGIPKGEI